METRMIRIISVIVLFFSSVAYGGGPQFEHRDSIISQEFENVYHDLRGKISKSGGTMEGTLQSNGQPSFMAYHSVSDVNVSGDNTTHNVSFNTEVFDTTNDFASDTFTAPVDGRYLLIASVEANQLATASHTDVAMDIVTSNRTYTHRFAVVPTSMTRTVMEIPVIADMDKNDTAYVRLTVYGSSKVVDITGGDASLTKFSGTLLN